MNDKTMNEFENLLNSEVNPEKKLGILRKRIFSNELYKSKYFIYKYFELFDTADKGYNNYADEILSNIKSLNNVSHLWKSGLDSDNLIDHVTNTRRDSSNSSNKQFKISDELKEKVLSFNIQPITILSKTDLKAYPSPMNTSSQNAPSTSKFFFKTIDNQKTPIATGTLSFGVPEQSSSANQTMNKFQKDYLNIKPNHEFQQSNLSNLDNSPFNNSKIVKNVVSHQNNFEMNHTNSYRENTGCAFKTAREQLGIDIRKKNSSTTSPQVSSLYGSTKKSLGTRKGAWGDFVAPIPGNRNELNNNRDYSPVPNGSPIVPKPMGNSKYESIINHESLKQFDAGKIESLLNEIMDSSKQVNWNDIAGLESPKKILQEIVMLPMLRPDIFIGIRAPAKGLLLFGPPGTGKTLIGKCIASQSKSTFFSISASSLTSKWVGEGEKMVRIMFTIARLFQPAVIFIDEIDSLLSQRNETEHESSRKIKTEFLIQMDGVGTGENEKLLLIGATNRPHEIDEAARRRFVKRVYIPLPSEEARRQIIENIIRNESSCITPEELAMIVSKSDGYSGADVTNLCKEAAMGPLRNLHHDQLANISLEDVPPITYDDFEQALKNVKSSVSPNDLEQYIKWNEIYGSSFNR